MTSGFKNSLSKTIQWFIPGTDPGKLLLAFFLSHFFILFNRSIGWDGYSVLNASYADLLKGFRAEGHPDMFPTMFYFLKTLTPYPILVFNCAVFIGSLVNTILSYLILKKIKIFTRTEVFVISLLIATIPYLFINLIGLPSLVFYAFFQAALYLLILYKEKDKLAFRVLALIGFYISFYYNSHISYFLLAFLIVYHYSEKPVRPGNFILKHIDFLLLPVIFIIVKKLSIESYEGPKVTDYNVVSLDSFKNLPAFLLYSFQHSFIQLFEICFDLLSKFYSVIIFLIVLPFVYFLVRDKPLDGMTKKIILYRNKTVSRPVFLLLLGAFLFFLGALPFSLVSKYPYFSEKNVVDLHQCNLYFGAAFMIYALVNIFISERWKKMLFALIISCFIFGGLNNYLVQNKFWLKTESMLINFRENEAVKTGHSFLVDDYAQDLNTSYIIQTYTLNGLMKRAFNEQTRFAITREELQEVREKKGSYKNAIDYRKNTKQYSMENYAPGNFDVNLVILDGKVVPTDFYTVKSLFYSYFDREKFQEAVKPIITIKTLPCTNCPLLTDTIAPLNSDR